MKCFSKLSINIQFRHLKSFAVMGLCCLPLIFLSHSVLASDGKNICIVSKYVMSNDKSWLISGDVFVSGHNKIEAKCASEVVEYEHSRILLNTGETISIAGEDKGKAVDDGKFKLRVHDNQGSVVAIIKAVYPEGEIVDIGLESRSNCPRGGVLIPVIVRIGELHKVLLVEFSADSKFISIQDHATVSKRVRHITLGPPLHQMLPIGLWVNEDDGSATVVRIVSQCMLEPDISAARSTQQ